MGNKITLIILLTATVMKFNVSVDSGVYYSTLDEKYHCVYENEEVGKCSSKLKCEKECMIVFETILKGIKHLNEKE